MKIINEVCQDEKGVKYFGSKKQCLEALVKTLVFTTEDQKFTEKELVAKVTEWRKDVQKKWLYPMPYVEGDEDASTEATFKEGRYTTHKLKEAVEGVKYRFNMSICGYMAISTLENSNFTRVYEILEDGKVVCDVQDDGSIKGRKLTSLNVEGRKRRTSEDVPFTNVNLKFSKPYFSIIDAGIDADDIEGIYHIEFTDIKESATTVTFKAITGCSGKEVTNLTKDDIQYLKADGAAQTITSLTIANGVYTLKGTGLVAGELKTNGVIDDGENLYES